MAADLRPFVDELGAHALVGEDRRSRQASSFADARFGSDFARRAFALHAFKHARDHPSGLYPRGTSQGTHVLENLRYPCPAERLNSTRDALWTHAAGFDRRRGHYRDDFRLPRDGEAGL